MPSAVGNQAENKESKLIIAIRNRAESASLKVKERIESVVLPRIASEGERYLYDMQNDFDAYIKRGEMKDIFAKAYPGWTNEEIAEYYEVLYGEPI